MAAANPLYGRYNPKLKPHENINLPAALLSRFDLIFLLLDKIDADMDKQLAYHVAKVHKDLKAPNMVQESNTVSADIMRSYIAHA